MHKAGGPIKRTVFLLCLAAAGIQAQQSDASQPTLTVRSTLVQAPVLVKTKGGKAILGFTAEDFLLTDDGVPQDLMLDRDTDSQPLALAIVVETGSAGAGHLDDYGQLDAVLDALVGGVEHRVAVIAFDAAPHLLMPFGPDTSLASRQLADLSPGDSGGAILDGVAFAVAQLRAQPIRYRRAILLIGETIDHGSKTTLSEALRLISDTNTTMYSFAFSSTRSDISHEASKYGKLSAANSGIAGPGAFGVELKSSDPGPAHGCFSRDGADAEYDGHYDKQVLDCISQLAPPLRLATMTFLASRNALRTNTAAAIARLNGGEFFPFHDAYGLKAGLIAVSNDVPNYYMLSFRPRPLSPGLHALRVEIKDRRPAVLKYRSEYWVDGDSAQ
jgi:VWFA-related protein